MAAPTFVAAGAHGSSTGAIAPGIPAGTQPGDLLLLVCETFDQVVTAPSGWTECPSSPVSRGGDTRVTAFYKFAVSGETAPTVADAGDHVIGVIVGFRGVDQANPFDVNQGTLVSPTTTNVYSCPSVVTTVADAMVVGICNTGRDQASTTWYGAPSNANLTGLTTLVSRGEDEGNGGSIGIFAGVKATAGATGSTTGTLQNNNFGYASLTLAILPTVSPGFISDTLTTTDSIVRRVGRVRNIADSGRSFVEFSDNFASALGPEYVDVEGLAPVGGVLTADPDTLSVAGLDLAMAPPAEIHFDFRTADTGDSTVEISIGGGRVTVEAFSGGDVSVYVDADRTEVAAVPHIANTLYHVKARVAVLAGEQVWAKVWKDGDPEPGSPQADFVLPVGVLAAVSSSLSLFGDGAEMDNLYIAGYAGDFISTPRSLFRAVTDTVTTTESVGIQLSEPIDYFRAVEDTVTTTENVSSLIERDIDVLPVPSPRVPVVSVVIDDVEMWPVIDYRRTRLTTYANGNPGAGEVWIRDLDRSFSVPTGAEVIVRFRGVPVWGGYVMAVRREYVFSRGKGGGPEPRYLVLEVVDYNILFRKRIYYDHDDPTHMMVAQWPNGTFDDTVIADVVSKYLDLEDDGLSFDIQRVGTPALPTDSCNPDATDKFSVGTGGWLWEQVFAAIASQTGAVWYIDPEKVVRYVDDSTRQSRFGFDGLSDQPGGTKAGYRDLEISYDGAGLVNEQYTWGMGQGTENPVVGHERDDDSVATHGLWQQAEIRFDMYCQTSVDRRAETWVQGSPQNRRGGKDDKIAIRCTVFNPFFRVGDVVAFENTTFGFSDDVPVRGAEITFPTPFDIKMVLTLGHTIDMPWNTHEFFFPDIGGMPDFPIFPFPGFPEFPPFCLCCDWVPEGTPVEGDLAISVCTSERIYDLDVFWDFSNGTTFDTSDTYQWSTAVTNTSDSDALSNPVGRVSGTGTGGAPRTGRFMLSPGTYEHGQIVFVSGKGSRNSLSSWGGQPPALARKRYWIEWFSAGGVSLGTDSLGETFTNRFTFGEWGNEFQMDLVSERLGAAVHSFRIYAEQQQYIDDITVSIWHSDGDCDGGGAGGYTATAPEDAQEVLQVYAGDGTLLVEGVDWEISPTDPTVILPITTWWLEGGPTVIYIPVHVPHPCDDLEDPDFTIDPGNGDNSGELPEEGDTDVDGVFFHLSQQFLPGSTQVWVDGLRIRLTLDYVEYPLLAKIKILDHIDVGAVTVTAAYTNFTLNNPVPL